MQSNSNIYVKNMFPRPLTKFELQLYPNHETENNKNRREHQKICSYGRILAASVLRMNIPDETCIIGFDDDVVIL